MFRTWLLEVPRKPLRMFLNVACDVTHPLPPSTLAYYVEAKHAPTVSRNAALSCWPFPTTLSSTIVIALSFQSPGCAAWHAGFPAKHSTFNSSCLLHFFELSFCVLFVVLHLAYL